MAVRIRHVISRRWRRSVTRGYLMIGLDVRSALRKQQRMTDPMTATPWDGADPAHLMQIEAIGPDRYANPGQSGLEHQVAMATDIPMPEQLETLAKYALRTGAPGASAAAQAIGHGLIDIKPVDPTWLDAR